MITSTIKLHKFLADAGVASRRKAEAMIAGGQVKVNDKLAHVGQRVNPQTDVVTLQGRQVSVPTQHTYILVNKPIGYVSTTSDEMERKTVLSLIPPNFLKKKWSPLPCWSP